MAEHPARVLLTDVPRVGDYRGGPRPPELTMLPSCLTACLERRGERLDVPPAPGHPWHNVYLHLLAVCGGCWRLQWPSDATWQPRAQQLLWMLDSPVEVLDRLFDAAGYDYELVVNSRYTDEFEHHGGIDDQPANWRHKVVTAIASQDTPVIAIGLVGPPEASLVCGYDQAGEVLLGWSFFQDMDEFRPAGAEPTGQFRQPDWFDRTLALIVLGARLPIMPLLERYRLALSRGLETLHTADVAGHANGLAAWDAFLAACDRQQVFPDDEPNRMQRYDCYHLTTLTAAEGRAWARLFCEQVAMADPALAEPLLSAAECYQGIHDLMWACWEFTGGNGQSAEHAQKLADGYRRGRICDLLRIALKLEREAAGHLEEALDRWPG